MAYLDRTFGAELENYLPADVSHAALAQAITSRGIECHSESYGHQTRPNWKIVTDGSLGDYVRGNEVVSPILQGESGLEAVGTVADALSDMGCTVNKSAGLHIHVGVGHQPIGFFKRLWKLYAHFEPIIDAFMPPSRRRSENAYCKTLTHIPFAKVDRCQSLDELLGLLGPAPRNSNSDNRRYHKLNFLSYRRYQTVEFRQHSGTTDARKIQMWTRFCLRLVEAAALGREPAGTTTAVGQINRARPGSKARIVGDLMLRSQGVTSAEAMAATGWPSISLPQQATACGLTFTTERTGREVRYYAQAAQASTPAVASLAALMDVTEASEAERHYFAARTRNLGGSVEWSA